MPVLEYHSPMPVSAEELFAWHARPGALERLMPTWTDVRILERSGGIADGGRVVLSVPVGPLRMKWVARHCGYDPPRQFVDEQVSGPFKRWVHTHRCLPGGILCDHIEYEPRLGGIGAGVARRQIDQTFLFRHARTRCDLARHARYAGKPLRVAIAGASGLIGRELRAFLCSGGHFVQTLVRRKADREAGEFGWDPAAGEIDAQSLEGLDAVVHLGGENIAGGRWTKGRKTRIESSRVEPTRFLCQTLARLKARPRVLVCASAIGYYGDRGEEICDESAAKGEGFLPEVCARWEGAADAAREAGIRVVHLRIGIVLSARGGALAKMATPFRMGVGGVIGSGRQYMSWIGADDLVGAIHEAIFNETLSGPVNGVAPGAVVNREFVKTLAKVLNRPSFFALPGPVVRMAFGEMGKSLLLEGAHVIPGKLAGAGFPFGFSELEAALRFELGRQPTPDAWGEISDT